MEIKCWMLDGERVSTAMGVAVPPVEVISSATVLIVEAGELGSGGKGTQVWGLEVVLADTMTMSVVSWWLEEDGCGKMGGRRDLPVYPFFARSIAICRPMPRDAPTTTATCFSEAIVHVSISLGLSNRAQRINNDAADGIDVGSLLSLPALVSS